MQSVDVWRSVVAEPEAGGRGKPCELAGALAGDGSCALAGEAVAEAPGLVAGVDDVRAVGEAVDDGFGEAGGVGDLGPFAERGGGGGDQRPAVVGVGEDLGDELGGAGGAGGRGGVG